MKRLVLFLLLALAASVWAGDPLTIIPGDGAVQVGGKKALTPPLDGLVDVWIWESRVSATTWLGEVNKKNFISNAGTMNTASQAITFATTGKNYVEGVAYDDLAFFCIHKLNPPNVQHVFADVRNGGTQEVSSEFYPGNTGFAWADKSTGWSNLVVKIPAVWGVWDEMHLYIPSSGTSYLEQNGVKTSGLTKTRTYLGVSRIYFWSGALGSNGASGLVKGFAIYNGAISDEKKEKIWQYLRSKCGEPL